MKGEKVEILLNSGNATTIGNPIASYPIAEVTGRLGGRTELSIRNLTNQVERWGEIYLVAIDRGGVRGGDKVTGKIFYTIRHSSRRGRTYHFSLVTSRRKHPRQGVDSYSVILSHCRIFVVTGTTRGNLQPFTGNNLASINNPIRSSALDGRGG